MPVRAEPLTAEGFAPFGQVLEAPAGTGRRFFNDALANARAQARVDLSIARVDPLTICPLIGKVIERHEFSSQTFLPLDARRYLVVVAPDTGNGEPDLARARAFVAGAHQGITYRMGTWHHGLTALDARASFAVLMWCDGGPGDEQFVTLPAPLAVQWSHLS